MDNNLDNKIWYVYIHTNKINQKKYIGISSENNPNTRWKNGNGYKQQVFYRAIEKYGWDNFEHEIIITNLTEEEAKQKEIELIAQYKTNDPNYGYNRSKGGDDLPEKTPELIEKISNSLKEYYKTEEGQKRKEIISQQKKEYFKTHENPFKGKHHTLETRKIMSEKAKLRPPHGNMSIDMIDENGTIIKTFISKKEALDYLNKVCYSPLTKALNNHTIYKGYYWAYHKEEHNNEI